jgi:tRNA (guanine-N7-)-methyltransferase
VGAHRPRRGVESRPNLILSALRPDGKDDGKRLLYGRRFGRKLRPRKRGLMDTLLPRIAVDPASLADGPGNLFDPSPTQVWLEIGFGNGEHIAEQARRNPDTGLIGCEPFINGVAALLDEIDRDGIGNIRVFPDDARIVLDALPDASIDRCFVLFPDPWPKSRHNRRRFVSPENLDSLARVLRDGAELRLASDHDDYVRWMLFHTLAHPAFEWLARGPADWREKPADWPPSRYEEKALARGECCAYLRFRRKSRR